MPAPFLSVFEHQRVAVGRVPGPATLSAAEAQAVARIAQDRPGFCTLGYQCVRFAQYVGVVQMGSRVLEVLPKVEEGAPHAADGRALLLRMLRLAGVSDAFAHLGTSHALRSATLLEVFIRAFLDALAPIIRVGLLRTYRSEEEDLRVVRGRLRVTVQAGRHALRPDRLACRYDELTADNAWNRGIKAALALVRPWIRDVELSQRWLETYMAFEDVAALACQPADLESLVCDRKTSNYARAIEWAIWILRLLSPALRAGDAKAPGVLFDMNRLFEAAVARTWSTQLKRQGLQVRSQHRGTTLATTLDSHRRRFVRLRPDLVIESGGAALLIADTKWKRVRVSPSGHLEPDEHDVHQLLAYAAAYSCGRIALVYPWHHEHAGSRDTAFELPGLACGAPRLDIICLDVDDEALAIRSGELRLPEK
jgi:5-methylcytosine-specific restriction enzyme subunit McrC